MATMPSVEFDLTLTNGEELEVHNPSDMPDPGTIAEIREPFIKAQIIAPREQWGRSWSSARNAAGYTRVCTTSRPSACSSPTTCRWWKSCSTSSTS